MHKANAFLILFGILIDWSINKKRNNQNRDSLRYIDGLVIFPGRLQANPSLKQKHIHCFGIHSLQCCSIVKLLVLCNLRRWTSLRINMRSVCRWIWHSVLYKLIFISPHNFWSAWVEESSFTRRTYVLSETRVSFKSLYFVGGRISSSNKINFICNN